MIKYLIDIDILIDYLKSSDPAVLFLESAMARSICYLSSITVAELYAGIREGNERQRFEKFLQAFEIVNIDASIAQIGGLLRREHGKRSGMGLADALIAASAENMGATLATLNKKHFKMIKKMIVPYIKK